MMTMAERAVRAPLIGETNRLLLALQHSDKHNVAAPTLRQTA